MTGRMQAEFERLYVAGDAATRAPTAASGDVQQRVRALVLEVVQPSGWDVLCVVWQGVQAELDLPAPAIAVSGTDALQLWFSSEQPLDVARAHAFLSALQARWLAALPPARVRLLPDPAQPSRAAPRVPAKQAGDVWSAFVSPDLAAVFSDTPWLDIEPGDEGQAALLRGLEAMKPTAFEAAMARLRRDDSTTQATPDTPMAEADARRFLLRVMNDERVDLALRIEAAKALL